MTPLQLSTASALLHDLNYLLELLEIFRNDEYKLRFQVQGVGRERTSGPVPIPFSKDLPIHSGAIAELLENKADSLVNQLSDLGVTDLPKV
jgi:hypothetical protein